MTTSEGNVHLRQKYSVKKNVPEKAGPILKSTLQALLCTVCSRLQHHILSPHIGLSYEHACMYMQMTIPTLSQIHEQKQNEQCLSNPSYIKVKANKEKKKKYLEFLSWLYTPKTCKLSC